MPRTRMDTGFSNLARALLSGKDVASNYPFTYPKFQEKTIMRTILTFLALFALCTVPAFAGGPADAELEQMVIERSCGADKLWIPEGSNVITTDSGSLAIEPPEGWVLVGYDANGEARVLADGDCSCDCTSSSGSCMPSIFQGNCSCTASGGCTSCSLSTGGGGGVEIQAQAFGDLGDTLKADSFTEVENSGYINLYAGIELTDDADLPMAFDAMFELPIVQKAASAFFDRLYPNGRAPEPVLLGDRFELPLGYELVRVNVFGRAALVAVPQTRGQALEKAEVAAAGGSCSCTSGSCTYESTNVPFKGTFHYCEGECSGTCTLSVNQE